MQYGPESTRVKSNTRIPSNGFAIVDTFDFNVHAQQRRFHAFAQRVEAQGARRAAVQGMMHDEVEAVQLGQVVAYDVAENESFKVAAHGFRRQLPFHGLIILGLAGVNANIGRIALIAAAAVSYIFQLNFHDIKPPLRAFQS